MRVTVDENAGFCYGVRRAVEAAFEAAEQRRDVWCLGKLIHNGDCMERLHRKGVRTAETPEEIPEGACVIVRAHGEPPQVMEKLREKRCEIVDATCRFVEKIHKIANTESENGCIIAIIGDAHHPEVIGIRGCCRQAEVLECEADTERFFDKYPPETSVCIVAQTTTDAIRAEKISECIKKHYTNCKKFDTICKDTARRQRSAALLAAECDGMIVIGGRDSSNTRRLFEVCSRICPNTQLIENASQLDASRFAGCQHVGITAGASTPAWIIKEVHSEL